MTTPAPGSPHDAPPAPAAAIRAARTDAGLTLDDLARAVGCSKALLSMMEAGQRSISETWAAGIERACGVTDSAIVDAVQWSQTPAPVRRELCASRDLTQQLIDAARKGTSLDALYERGALHTLAESNAPNVEPASDLEPVPIINRVAAGAPTEFTDLDYPPNVADDYIECPRGDVIAAARFAARVIGDSMAPTYRDGEIVVFDPALSTPDGSDCFVRLARNDESTFKRVEFDDDDGRVRLVPRNPAYPTRTVSREQITGIYRAAYVLRPV